MNRPVCVAMLLLTNDKRWIALHKREKEPHTGTWEVMGTYVKNGETLEAACRRKLAQGCDVTRTVDLDFSGRVYDAPDRHPGGNSIALVYTAVLTGPGLPVLPSDCEWHELATLSRNRSEFALDNRKMIEDELRV